MFIIFLDIHPLFLQIIYPTIKVRLNYTQYGSLPDWYGSHLAHYGLISKRKGSFLERHGSLLAQCDLFFRNNYTLFERFALYLLRGRNLNAFILSDISLWFCPIDISKLVIKKVFFLHQCHAIFKYNPI